MRIACPSCNAVYQVPDEKLGEGRVVRCVRCSTDWLPVVAMPPPSGAGSAGEPLAETIAKPGAKPGAEAISEAMTEPAREVRAELEPEVPVRRMALDEEAGAMAGAAPPAEAATVPGGRRSPWLAVAWVVSVLAVGGGVAALGVWHEAVMAAWPPSVRAYAGIGLAARP